MQRQPIRVLIADDSPDLRELLSDLVELSPALVLAGTAGDAVEAIELAERMRPDVVVLDVNMPGGGGSHAAREISRRIPGARILALSASGEREAVFGMLQSGAAGYVVKGAPVAEIVEAITNAAGGGTVLSPHVAGGVVDELVAELDRRTDLDEQRERWRRRIEAAIDDGELEMAFQPVFDLITGEVIGAEALARFPSAPRTGPETWFRRAGELGLREPLELAAAGRALSEQHRLPPGTWLSLNVSPDTAMSPALADLLGPYDTRRLVIEMTEHDPVEDYDRLSKALGQLRSGGCRIAVDDAGSGAAGLRHILLVGAEFIKLDAELSQGIADHEARGAVGRALITFATEIGADVIAEGIETEPQRNALRGLGVHLGQGYHLARPSTLPLAR